MLSIFYLVCLVISVGNLLHLTQKKNIYADKYYWTTMILIPIINLGYWIKSTVHSPEAAVVTLCFIYLDSTVLLVLVLLAALKSVNVVLPKTIKLIIYGITAAHLMSIWLCKDTTYYYSSVTVRTTAAGAETILTAGPLKITHYIFLAAIFIAMVSVLIYGFTKKATFSKRTLMSYAFMAVFGLIIYLAEIILGADFTMLPGLYALGSFMIAMTHDHIQSHDLFNLIGERQAKTGNRGFCALDMNQCLLGFNERFGEMLPEIKNVVIDEKIPTEYRFSRMIYEALDQFEEQKDYSGKMTVDNQVFRLTISSFSINDEKTDGYLLELTDITEEQKHLDVVKQYNEKLMKEVEEKTEHIIEIQNSVVLGLANMVENRDDNTGGHVKRTSDVVKILINEIRKQGSYKMDSAKANAIIRAAAMHDLGKISIDNTILCKPGRLSEEEYGVMKTHAPKSGEIVRIILDGVEEENFVTTAYNLARYHHERWDGKGYPEGLIGESIPVEARIMAVADVYDALVSKRCYKEAMSFEEAAKIMNECMGSQFDPAMRPIFQAARVKLETYYSLDL